MEIYICTKYIKSIAKNIPNFKIFIIIHTYVCKYVDKLRTSNAFYTR